MPSSDTHFQGKGVGTKYKESPVSIRFSSEVRAALKKMSNAQDYVRQAVDEKLSLDKLPSVLIGSKSRLPRKSGVYVVIDGQGTVQYVGLSANMRQRWGNHHKHDDLSKLEGARIAYLLVTDQDLLVPIERALIAWFSPPFNDGFGGRRPPDWDEPKKKRTLSVTETGFEGALKVARSLGCNSVSDLLEELGRGAIRASKSRD